MESGRSLRMHNVCRCATRSGSTTWRQDRSRWTNMSTAWAIWDRSEHQHLSWFVIIFHLEFHFLAGHPQILVVKWTHFCGKTGWLGDLHRRFRNDWKWYPINTLWGFINLGFTWQKVCFTMEIMIRVAKHWTATPNKPMRVTAISGRGTLNDTVQLHFCDVWHIHSRRQHLTNAWRVTLTFYTFFYPGFKLSNTSLGWGETLSGFLLNCLFAPERTIWILIPSRLYEIPPSLLIYISEFFVSTYLDHQKGHLNPFPLI